jgi:signal transduction histidine kinase/ligand-binding sensor domain-containing protein
MAVRFGRGVKVSARWIRVVTITASLTCAVRAHAAGLHYRLWTIEDGLPTGSVRAIAQTPDGYLWIATLDGLVRFDGVRMRLFQRSDQPRMTSNRCLSLHVDRRGDLWVTTEDGGLLRLRGDEVRAFGTADGLPATQTLWVEEDQAGRLFVASWSGRAVLEGDRFQPAPPYEEIVPRMAPGEAPLSPHEHEALDTALRSFRLPDTWTDRMDDTWIVTGSGTALRPTPRGLVRVRWPAVASGKRLPQTWTRVREGAAGRLWLLQDGYLYLREADRWTAYPNPVPAAILPLPRDMFEDREGTLWIAGDGGLVQASATPVRAVVPQPSLDANVYTVAPDREGRVWVGTNTVPAVLDRRTEAFADLREQSWWPHNFINGIVPDADGSLIAGGPGGLYRVWPGRRSEVLRKGFGELRDSVRDTHGALWIAVEGNGVLRQSGADWERLSGLPSSDARALLVSRDGSLWIGTYGGLSRLSNGTVRTWTEADGLSSNRVRSLYEDGSGTLWIGTYDGGLNRFAGGKLVPIRKRDGLFDDGAFAILEDDEERLWISSNRGVYAVHRKDLEAFAEGTLRRIACRSWTSLDGMPSSECNGGRQPAGFRADDGTLWFSTQAGIAVIDPRAVAVNGTPPLVVLEEITTDRRTLAVGPSITLAPGERRLEVRYTACTFVNPKGTRFRHRLVPFDPDWVEAGDRRFAQYAYVPPGRYALEVMAANSDGVWSRSAASLAIDVRPFWWQTLWFQASATLLVAGALAGAYARRVSHLKQRRAEQEAFARSLLESQEAERKRIAGELHDGIGQTLVVIRNRALLGLKDGDLVAQIAEISTAAAAGVEDVRKIAYGLRPYQIDRLGLRRALLAVVEQSADSSGIPIAAEVGNVDGVFPADAEINVYRIVQEGLNNLARHARAKQGHVAVTVAGGEVVITIEDDGAGFDPASLAAGGGMGLSGIAERARILGGWSTVRSSPGQGTAVIVHLPRSGRDR